MTQTTHLNDNFVELTEAEKTANKMRVALNSVANYSAAIGDVRTAAAFREVVKTATDASLVTLKDALNDPH